VIVPQLPGLGYDVQWGQIHDRPIPDTNIEPPALLDPRSGITPDSRCADPDWVHAAAAHRDGRFRAALGDEDVDHLESTFFCAK
jgi:hypothetical protein